MKLEKVVYINVMDSGDDAWLRASKNKEDVIEDDGPTQIGEYKLVRIFRLKKEAKEC